MADITTITESAQALFSAIGDLVGLKNMPEPKKPNKGEPDSGCIWTYDDFKEHYKGLRSRGQTNQMTIKKVWDSVHVQGGGSFKEIEDIFEKDAEWYRSSIYIARKLLVDIQTISKKFPMVESQGWSKILYSRGSDVVMGTIANLFKKANDCQKKLDSDAKSKGVIFGDVNKWSPADMYWSCPAARTALAKELTKANTAECYTFLELNKCIMRLIDSGGLLPLSLKKAGPAVKLVQVNFDRDCERKSVAWFYCGTLRRGNKTPMPTWSNWTPNKITSVGAGTKIPGQRKIVYSGAAARDLVIQIAEKKSLRGQKQDGKRYIKIRHDASGGGATFKIQIYEQSGQEPAGSLASPKQLGGVMNKVGKKGGTAGTAWFSNYTRAVVEFNKVVGPSASSAKTGGMKLYGWEAVTDTGSPPYGIGKLNASTKRKNTILDMRQLYWAKNNLKIKPNEYKDRYEMLAGNASGQKITNVCLKELHAWLKADQERADKFVRYVYLYATSRSATSARFVIAKGA